MIELKSYRLTIRDNLPEDLEGYHELFSSSDNMLYLPGMLTKSLEESKNSLNESIDDSHRRIRRKYFFAVIEAKSGKYVGQVGFTKLSDSMGGLGYFMLPEFRGFGYATEAAIRVIRFAFARLGLSVMQSGCHIDNKASEKVMIKLGMSKVSESADRLEYEIRKSRQIKHS